MPEHTGEEGDRLLRTFDLDRLNAPRSVRDPGTFPTLVRDINDNGIVVPILVNTDLFVIDGSRRLAAARELGWQTVPCEVTNDFQRMLANLAEARKYTGPVDWRRAVELVTDLFEYGQKWRFGYNADEMRGTVKGARKKIEGSASWKRQLRETIVDLTDWQLDAYQWIATTGALGMQRSPQHQEAFKRIIAQLDAGTIQVSNAERMTRHLGRDVAPNRVEEVLQRWERRINLRAARPQPEVQEPVRDRTRTGRKKVVPQVRVPDGMAAATNLLSQIEGMATGLRDTSIDTNIDPEVRAYLEQSIRKIRGQVNLFAKRLKGNSEQ